MPSSTTHPLRADVLVVEDEAVIAADLTACLEEMGYHVVGEAACGEDALRQARQHRPDVVLMDIVLNGEMDGIAAADRLRREQDIPVIFLTSHADTGTLRRARESQPYGYLIKPFSEQDLRAAIETTLYRHHSESRLRKLDQWTALTLQSIGDGVVTTDLDGRVTFLNAAAERITGWKSCDAVGRAYPEIFQPADAASRRCIRQLLTQVIATGGAVEIQDGTRLLSRQGREYPIADSAAPVRDATDRVSGMVVVFRDRSEAEQAEERRQRVDRQLQEAQKLESLGLMASGIAHDFNNLLTGIGGNVALCRMKLHSKSPLHEHLSKIQSISHRAADLCKQMLDYSGAGAFSAAPIDLSTLVGDKTPLLRTSISKKSALVFDLAPDLPPVLGDASQLQQVIMNLVINASDAIGKRSGEIRLRTGVLWADATLLATAVHAPELPEGEYVSLEVEDTGCGMSPETLSRIFDPFFTTKFTGRGLGLSAVLGIVRTHRGALLVESAPGHGSTFRLLLPASVPAAQPTAKAQTTPPPPAGEWRGSGKVLLVDDEEEVRLVLGELLRALGFDPVEAAHGRAALAVCGAGAEYRLVLMDVTMPVMDGAETLVELRKIHPTLPVLFMSGYAAREALARIGDDRHCDFLQKPFLPGQLEQKLRSVLA